MKSSAPGGDEAVTGGMVRLEMSISLDGFAAGAGVSVEHPMGHDRGLIHDWMFNGKTDREAKAWEEEQFAGTGALIRATRRSSSGSVPGAAIPHSTRHASSFPITPGR